MNLRPPGYEPDELPTALLRDIELGPVGAGDRTRTGTVLLPGDFKSPVSTIPPHRRIRHLLEYHTARPVSTPFEKNISTKSQNPVARRAFLRYNVSTEQTGTGGTSYEYLA